MDKDRPNRQPALGHDGLWLWLTALAIVLTMLGGWLIGYAAAALAGLGAGGPVRWLADPGPAGRWSLAATLWLTAILAALGVLGWWAARLVGAARAGREWTDSLASSMSSRHDLAELLPEAVAADTERLGSQQAGIGISLGKAVLTRQWLYAT
jgi:hypothetical protein